MSAKKGHQAVARASPDTEALLSSADEDEDDNNSKMSIPLHPSESLPPQRAVRRGSWLTEVRTEQRKYTPGDLSLGSTSDSNKPTNLYAASGTPSEAAMTISERHEDCYASLGELCKIAMTSGNYHQHLTEEFDKYCLWAGNVGAAHCGKTYRLSLDYRLREASFYRDQVLKLMDTLRRQTTKAIQILKGDRIPFDALSSDSDSNDGGLSEHGLEAQTTEKEEDSPWEVSSDSETEADAIAQSSDKKHTAPASEKTATMRPPEQPPVQARGRTELQQLVDSIRLLVTCLYKLPLRRPAPVDRLNDKSAEEVSHFQHFDVAYVLDKFPDERLSPIVKLRLGKMITRRRQLLIYRQKHKAGLRTNIRSKSHVVASTFKLQDTASIGNDSKVFGELDTQIAHETHNRPESSWWTFPTRASKLRMEGSTLLDTTPLFAPSIAESESTQSRTSLAGSERTREIGIEVPPRPTSSQNGVHLTRFECAYCSLTPYIRSDRSWKKHVLNDIQPYVCTYPDCNLPDHIFEDQDKWYSHELQYHRVEFFCNTAGHQVHMEQTSFEIHLKDDHCIDLQSSPELLQIFRRPSQCPGGICNLCYQRTKNMKTHISRHLQQLSLFAIPRADYSAGDEKLDNDSNLPQDNAQGSRSQDAKETFSEDSSTSSNDFEDEDRTSKDDPENYSEDQVDQAKVPATLDMVWDFATGNAQWPQRLAETVQRLPEAFEEYAQLWEPVQVDYLPPGSVVTLSHEIKSFVERKEVLEYTAPLLYANFATLSNILKIFYHQNPALRILRVRDILLVLASAMKSEPKNVLLLADANFWTLTVLRHLIVFSRLFEQVLHAFVDTSWETSRLTLLAHSRKLENGLISFVAARSDAHGIDANGQLQVARSPWTHEYEKTNLFFAVLHLFDIPSITLKEDIVRNWTIWTQDAALQDPKTYHRRLDQEHSTCLHRSDFSTEEAYKAWSIRESADPARLVVSLLLPDKKREYASKSWFDDQGEDTRQENDRPYVFIPVYPREQYRIVMEQALWHDIKTYDIKTYPYDQSRLSHKPRTEFTGNPLLSKASSQLLKELGTRWHIPHASRCILFLNVIRQIHNGIDQDILEAAFEFFKESCFPELGSQETDKSTYHNSVIAQWPIIDLELYREVLEDVHDKLMMLLFHGMTTCYTAGPLPISRILYTLREHIYTDDDLLETATYRRRGTAEMRYILRRKAIDAYRLMYTDIISRPGNDESQLHKVAQLGDSILAIVENTQSLYTEVLVVMDVNVSAIFIEDVFPSYARDVKRLISEVGKMSQAQEYAIDNGVIFDLCRTLVEMRRVYDEVGPQAGDDGPILELPAETLLEKFVLHWLEEASEALFNIASSISKDDFTIVGTELSYRRQSMSIIEMFDALRKCVDRLVELRWKNKLQYAEFMTIMSKGINRCVTKYAQVLWQMFTAAMGDSLIEVDFDATAEKQGDTSQIAAYTPLAMLNDLENAISRCVTLKTKMQVDAWAQILQENAKTKALHKVAIHIVKAEGLLELRSGSMCPYVLLSDEQQNILAKSRIALDSLDPHWNSEMDYNTNGPEKIQATIWNWSPADDLPYVAYLTIEASDFTRRDPRQLWLDMKPQGQLLLNISAEEVREDLYRTHPARRYYLIGSAIPDPEKVAIALDPLFQKFSKHLGTLEAILTEPGLLSVLKDVWKDILMMIESLLLPTLYRRTTQQQPLEQEQLLFEYFQTIGKNMGMQDSFTRKILKCYQSLMALCKANPVATCVRQEEAWQQRFRPMLGNINTPQTEEDEEVFVQPRDDTVLKILRMRPEEDVQDYVDARVKEKGALLAS
ncbi:hypothetical protein BT63DRAFT_452943 [Microthyrium microscopicum]|uniref:C2H2-type domain-containing protein n=1 Tax=Microthyrium microscopicum TaxID=703497 RepID=A0A6A6UL85_9PEZI|nr:hypothetical protein BT63DRAFT_452943 [Microthyrium microscopicum]